MPRRDAAGSPYWRRLSVVWAVVVAFLLLLPPARLPPRPDRWPLAGTADEAVHLVLFAVLGWLAGRALLAGRGRRGGPVLCLGLLTGYALLTELLQLLVPGRSCEAGDLAADVAGAVLGTWIARRQTDASSGVVAAGVAGATLDR